MHAADNRAEVPAIEPVPAGVLVVDKPVGPTSMQIVADVRRRAGGARTGHAGTLDPLATGVLVLAIGRATRSIEQIMATRKGYETVIDLTAFTTTDDSAGERTEVTPAAPPAEPAVLASLDAFRGRFLQRPPSFSAVKVGGRRAYALARRGAAAELAPREVTVGRLDLISYEWPLVALRIECGKGFYVRSLARDLGVALGTGGHCRSIRRTSVGPFTLSEAHRPEQLPARIGQADMIPLDEALRRVVNDGAPPVGATPAR